MAELISTYTDTKNNTHSVEHFTPPENSPEKQQIAEELFRVLSQKANRKAE